MVQWYAYKSVNTDVELRDGGRDEGGVVDVDGRFFFFQAEDGIRDVAVTGVQTCALPIFSHRGVPALRLYFRISSGWNCPSATMSRREALQTRSCATPSNRQALRTWLRSTPCLRVDMTAVRTCPADNGSG